MTPVTFQQCIFPDCGQTYGCDEVLFACRQCGGLLDVRYDWSKCFVPKDLSFFDSRRCSPNVPLRGITEPAPGMFQEVSGVWRFRELLPIAPPEDLVTIGEGRTILQQADELAAHLGFKPGRLFLQYEGFNPTGSFKDNGMAAAFTVARGLGRRRIACASTGNTSASLALYAAATQTAGGEPMEAIVFVGAGKIALGKLAQALDFGARTLQVQGDFDRCMTLIQQSADRLDLYVVNSVNPFRLEGQKTIIYRILQALRREVPDWIIVPGGNLGNSSAFGKALVELRDLGLLQRLPRLAIINAQGANSLAELYNDHGLRFNRGRIDQKRIDDYYAARTAAGRHAQTVASAIEIGRPVNLSKALRSLEDLNGLVRAVSDEAILDGKALVGRYGYGCEPASGATIAGARLLMDEQIVSPSDRVVCILTGHALKDPGITVQYHSDLDRPSSQRRYANPPVSVPADLNAIAGVLNVSN